MTRIGLMMIVKDEAPVIERCLASVRPFVDWWVVVDTGSSDDTPALVAAALDGVPGEVHHREWVDFGHNRQEALELARASEHAGDDDYVLWIDADNELARVPTHRPDLDRDGYHLTVDHDGTRYSCLALIRLRSPWRWVGPVHEYLDLPSSTVGELTEPLIVAHHDGARSRDPHTYRRDAALIEQALERDPGDPRLQFYLAQSWHDAEEPERAIQAYRVRAQNPGGWEQERWYSLLRIGQLVARTGGPDAEVRDALLAAYQLCPWRAEALVELSRFERERERYATALLYARPATKLPMPGGEALFVDADSYTWRGWDEIAISSYYVGRYADGVVAAKRALAVRPDDERLRANLAWNQDRLTAGPGVP